MVINRIDIIPSILYFNNNLESYFCTQPNKNNMNGNYQNKNKKTQSFNKYDDIVNILNTGLTCSLVNIESQLVRHSIMIVNTLGFDYISQIRSLSTLKLVAYKLIQKCVSQTHMEKQHQNKQQLGDDQFKHTLLQLHQFLDQIAPVLPKVKFRSKTEKVIGSSLDYHSKLQHFQNEILNIIDSVSTSQPTKGLLPEQENILLQQMQQTIEQKNSKISQIEKKLQEIILTNRTLENLIQKYQLQKQQLEEQLKAKKEMLSMLQSKIQYNPKQLQSNKQSFLQSAELESQLLQFQQEQPKFQRDESLQRMLYIQALTIQAITQ